MGNRTFYDQMLVDACQHQQLKITDEVDVTTMQEYMQACKNIHSYCLVTLRPHFFSACIQYASTVDETPSYLGGKDNTWRKLSLDGMSCHRWSTATNGLLCVSAAFISSNEDSPSL